MGNFKCCNYNENPKFRNNEFFSGFVINEACTGIVLVLEILRILFAVTPAFAIPAVSP
jgi:hypothetical protein